MVLYKTQKIVCVNIFIYVSNDIYIYIYIFGIYHYIERDLFKKITDIRELFIQ